MKRTFMIGVAAGALLAGVNIAASQGTMERQPPAASGGGANMEQQKSGSGAQQPQGQRAQDAQKPGDQKQDAQKQDAQKQGDAKSGDGGKTLSAEQKTKVRETVIRSSNAPRVTNVNFSVTVGAVVPRDVRFAPLPPILVDIYPQWRSYQYVIVEERIIIIEPSSYKIVAIVVV